MIPAQPHSPETSRPAYLWACGKNVEGSCDMMSMSIVICLLCAQNCTNQSWFPHVSTVYSVLCKIFTHFFHPRDFRLSLSTGPGSRTTSLGATPPRGWDGFFPDLGMGQGIQGVQGMKIHQGMKQSLVLVMHWCTRDSTRHGWII